MKFEILQSTISDAKILHFRPQTLIRDGQGRAISHSSLDPNEDPVSGLERVSSALNIQNAQRRLYRERTRRMQEAADEPRAIPSSANAHTLSEKFESLDYEIVENELYRAAESDKEHQQKLFRQSVDRWVVCFLIGVCTAIVAAFIDIMVYYSSKLKFHLMISSLVSVCEHQSIGDAGCMWIVLSAWAAYNSAAGSGIPHIKCFLNGIQIPGVVRLKTLFVKAVGVACSVGGGLAAGKEGPMIHSGAVVAAGISQGRCLTFPMDFRIFRYFRNDRAGAAAGVSAAFASPIGGVLFSLEEGASFWNQSLTWRMFFSAMISTFTLNCFLSVFYGRAGYLSWDGLANFGVFDNKSAYALKNYVKTRRQKFFECILVAAASAFTGFITLFDKAMVSQRKIQCCGKSVFPKSRRKCKESFAQSYKLVSSIYSSNICYRIFCAYPLDIWFVGASGIFIPCLLTGAAWGRLFGIGVEYLFPNLAGIDPGKYALAGAAAQLGGVVRMTISLTAIIVEATKDISFGLPIMLVLMIAKWVGDIFNEGLYDSHIALAEIPLLDGMHPNYLGTS
uniref:Uncharacterized protein n=1 Tax=Ditylenchus dipsaci TaxID=166011 RepID=A0A915D9R7_9BILA